MTSSDVVFFALPAAGFIVFGVFVAAVVAAVWNVKKPGR
jgi:hypothetical protein